MEELKEFLKNIKMEILALLAVACMVFLFWGTGRSSGKEVGNPEGCRHKWVLYKELQVTRDDEPEDVIGFKKVYECTKCMEFMTKKIDITEGD